MSGDISGMVQMALCDGGMVSQPTQHFRENEPIYRYIGERLDQTKQSYLEADSLTRLRLLFDSTTYALLTANTPLEQADRAFEIYRDHYPDLCREDLTHNIAEAGIGFYNLKSDGICQNWNNMDLFRDIDNLLMTGQDDKAQSRLMEARRIGPAKSAFALAMLGWTDHACIDRHVARAVGINPKEYEKYSASEYKSLVDRVFQQIPELQDEISPFLLQWIIFDVQRGEIETHDLFFQHVEFITS